MSVHDRQPSESKTQASCARRSGSSCVSAYAPAQIDFPVICFVVRVRLRPSSERPLPHHGAEGGRRRRRPVSPGCGCREGVWQARLGADRSRPDSPRCRAASTTACPSTCSPSTRWAGDRRRPEHTIARDLGSFGRLGGCGAGVRCAALACCVRLGTTSNSVIQLGDNIGFLTLPAASACLIPPGWNLEVWPHVDDIISGRFRWVQRDMQKSLPSIVPERSYRDRHYHYQPSVCLHRHGESFTSSRRIGTARENTHKIRRRQGSTGPTHTGSSAVGLPLIGVRTAKRKQGSTMSEAGRTDCQASLHKRCMHTPPHRSCGPSVALRRRVLTDCAPWRARPLAGSARGGKEKMGGAAPWPRSILWARAVLDEALCEIGQAQTWEVLQESASRQRTVLADIMRRGSVAARARPHGCRGGRVRAADLPCVSARQLPEASSGRFRLGRPPS